MQIAELDRTSGSCLGGETVWLRTSSSLSSQGGLSIQFSNAAVGWMAEGVFSETNVYGQRLIIFKTPAYLDPRLSNSIDVEVSLCSVDGSFKSDPIPYTYLPICQTKQSAHPICNGNIEETSQNSSEHCIAKYVDFKAIQSGTEASDAKALLDIVQSIWNNQLELIVQFAKESNVESLLRQWVKLLNVKTDDGNTVFHIAAQHGQTQALQTFLSVTRVKESEYVNVQNANLETPLHVAVRSSQTDCVHYLLTACADRSLLDGEGNSLAHCLADADSEDIYKDILFPPPPARRKEMPPLDLNLANHEGLTALHLAIIKRKLPLIENLIEAGADVSAPAGQGGKTALHFAIESAHPGVLHALIEGGCDVNAEAENGLTALHLAVHFGTQWAVAKLISAGADPERCTSSLQPVEMDNSSVTNEFSAWDLARHSEHLTKLLKKEPEATQAALSQINTYASNGQSTSDSTLPLGSSFKDDVSSIDFVTRIRLSKLLDEGGWELLAASLGCEHMIEPLKCVSDSSSTLLFLDQFEQMPNATVSNLLRALDECGYRGAMELIVKKQSQAHYNDNHPLEPAGDVPGLESSEDEESVPRTNEP